MLRVALLSICVLLAGVNVSAQPAAVQPRTVPPGGMRPSLVAISVRNLDDSVAWYRDVLGFKQAERMGSAKEGIAVAMLDAAGFRLELVEKRGSVAPGQCTDVSNPAQLQGMGKLAFAVDDAASLSRELKARGTTFVIDLRDDAKRGVRWFIVKDNDGNWIQFFEDIGRADDSPPQSRAAQHDRAFWRGIIQANYVVPPGSSADALSEELSALLGSRDPELRDDIAYTLLAQWLAIAPRISDAQARRLVDRWVANVSAGDARGASAVLLRSFSALCLAAAMARENGTPYVGQERYRAVLDAALRYFDAEHDPRGFDPALGWVHATAHTADLLKFLARSPHLRPADQTRMLRAIARKAEAADVWVSGEDERVARVVLSLVTRADAQWDAYAAFLKDVGAMSQFPERPTLQALARQQNARHLLTGLCAVLATTEETAAIVRARTELTGALKGR